MFFKRKKEQVNNHPMVGKVYKLDNDNPFKSFFVKIIDVKKGTRGEEWVKYNIMLESGFVLSRDNSEKMSVFIKIYKEV